MSFNVLNNCNYIFISLKVHKREAGVGDVCFRPNVVPKGKVRVQYSKKFF